MSNAAISWASFFSQSTLGTRLVMFTMANHASDDQSFTYCSVKTIAREAKLSERQTQRCIRELVEMGELMPVGKHTFQNGIVTNKYQLILAQKWIKEQVASKSAWGDKMSPGGVTNNTLGGDIQVIQGVTPVSPKSNNTIHKTEEEAAKPPSNPEPPKEGLRVEEIKEKPKRLPKPLTPDQERFLTLWLAAFKEQFGSAKVPSSEDRAAGCRILLNGLTPEQVVAIAKAAWAKMDEKGMFNCQYATSLISFDKHYDKVIATMSPYMATLKNQPTQKLSAASTFGQTAKRIVTDEERRNAAASGYTIDEDGQYIRSR